MRRPWSVATTRLRTMSSTGWPMRWPTDCWSTAWGRRLSWVFTSRVGPRIVGLLGVLKAGGAYLPLDTEHPPERLAAMLDDSGAAVLVTEDRRLEQVPGNPRLVVTVDPLAESRARTSRRRTPA